MANRRMFSRVVVRSDNFASLPHSTQVLYFQLGMEADDDGFVDSANSVRQLFRCRKSDLQLLVDKEYLIEFPNSLYLIRHWCVHNKIRKDRHQNSQYLDANRFLVTMDDDGCYHCLTGSLHQDEVKET